MEETCDLLVVGSGASGLSAAVTAAYHGLHVVVAEKEELMGGATAWSGGWIWAPLNPLARRAGIREDVSAPRTYLEHELGDRFDASRIDAFLHHTPRMISFFERKTSLKFVDGNAIADIHGEQPGAGTGGRSVAAAPYDARNLRPMVKILRDTMRETAFLGMPIMAGADLWAFLTATRSFRSFAHVTRRLTRHLWDLAVHGRAMQLVNGIALVARLMRSAHDLGVDLRVNAPVVRLLSKDGKVTGAVLKTEEGERVIHARRGIVLAAGGFPHDIARRRELFPHAPTGREHWALPPLCASGDGMRLGETAGGGVDTRLAAAGAWCPVSLVPYRDGTFGHFPHIIDRGKPGLIGVLANGRRFVNEASGYYDYVAAMLKTVPSGQEVASWLICDMASIMGGFYPAGGINLGPAMTFGYVAGRHAAGVSEFETDDPDAVVV